MLLTGFERFHTHPSNPSAAAAEAQGGARQKRGIAVPFFGVAEQGEVFEGA